LWKFDVHSLAFALHQQLSVTTALQEKLNRGVTGVGRHKILPLAVQC
jgi:hypothetical protein